MKRIVDSLCILESKTIDGHTYEVCATETGDFDEGSSTLALKLDSFVRQVSSREADVTTRPRWLPPSETLRHHISEDEAAEDARAVFSDWRRKVQRAIPGLNDFTAATNHPFPLIP